MYKNLAKGTASILCLLSALASADTKNTSSQDTVQSYADNADVQAFIAQLVAEHGFDGEILKQQFAQAEKKQSIIDAMTRPAEKTLNWGGYRNIFIKESRIDKGVEFWQKNADALKKVSDETGVPQQIIVAIIGVETFYGRHKGNYRVIDALSTLSFDYPPRSKFFKKELEQFFLLAKEQNKDPLELKGSYAGAMGYGQFIPSSYRHYAADYDNDGFIDIWDNEQDAIASVANYFVKHRWRAGESVTMPARVDEAHNFDLLNKSLKPKETVGSLAEAGFHPETPVLSDAPATIMKMETDQGDEYWMGLHNFYVITRYNHSRLYAMAVYQLSEKIAERYQAAKAG